MKSPLFRIDKAMKAVQEALLDGELGEEVRHRREQEEGEREGGREGGVAGHECRRIQGERGAGSSSSSRFYFLSYLDPSL